MIQTHGRAVSDPRGTGGHGAPGEAAGDRTGGVRAALASLDLTNPANAFAYGLAMGQAIEREQTDAVDDQVHRTAVAEARTLIDRADRRAATDKSGARPEDHLGGLASWEGTAATAVPTTDGAYSR